VSGSQRSAPWSTDRCWAPRRWLRDDNAEAVELLQSALTPPGQPASRSQVGGSGWKATSGRPWSYRSLDEAAELAAELPGPGRAATAPTIIGVGLRIEGLVQASRGNLDEAISALQQA